ncbi:hypothetical protein T265_15420, partial [Opisthorchis viverrini]
MFELHLRPHYQILLEGQIATFYHQPLCVLICMLVRSIISWSCDKAFVGRDARTQSRAILHHHIPGTSEPITTGIIQTIIDRRGDWNPTAESANLHPKETCATSGFELAYETSGPTVYPTLTANTDIHVFDDDDDDDDDDDLDDDDDDDDDGDDDDDDDDDDDTTKHLRSKA